MYKDIGCGVAGLALAAAVYFLADDLPRSLLADPTGADGLPKLLAYVLGGLSLLLIVGALRRAPAVATVERESIDKHLRSAGMLALGTLYLVLLPWLGYVLTIFLFILVVAVYAGTRLDWKPVAVSAIGAGALWFSFVKLFSIPMPTGTLF